MICAPRQCHEGPTQSLFTAFCVSSRSLVPKFTRTPFENRKICFLNRKRRRNLNSISFDWPERKQTQAQSRFDLFSRALEMSIKKKPARAHKV